jgi:non-ribosomal peptide synthase protein (TIGR01720 family)
LSGFKNELKRKPQISFNYLGQFDADTNKGSFVPSTISAGSSVSQDSSRTYSIDINAIVSSGKLFINLNYNRNEFSEERMLNFLSDFKKHLMLIIDHCISKEDTTNTPSDFTYSNLSIQQLSELEDDLEDLL